MSELKVNAELAGRLTISIVSHGHEELLHALLHDLNTQRSMRGVEVTVTLNLEHERFDPVPYGALRVVVIRNATPRGFGANHNSAFARSSTRWFAILNPDLRIADSRCFETLLEAACKHHDTGMFAPRVISSAGEIEDAVRHNLTPLNLLARRSARGKAAVPDTSISARRGKRFYWLAGMFLLVRSDAFDAVGGFDERFFLYCEDFDLSARMFNAGYALTQVPQAIVVHDAQRDSHRSPRHLRLHVASLLKVWCSAAFWRVVRADRQARAAGGGDVA